MVAITMFSRLDNPLGILKCKIITYKHDVLPRFWHALIKDSNRLTLTNHKPQQMVSLWSGTFVE